MRKSPQSRTPVKKPAKKSKPAKPDKKQKPPAEDDLYDQGDMATPERDAPYEDGL